MIVSYNILLYTAVLKELQFLFLLFESLSLTTPSHLQRKHPLAKKDWYPSLANRLFSPNTGSLWFVGSFGQLVVLGLACWIKSRNVPWCDKLKSKTIKVEGNTKIARNVAFLKLLSLETIINASGSNTQTHAHTSGSFTCKKYIYIDVTKATKTFALKPSLHGSHGYRLSPT